MAEVQAAVAEGLDQHLGSQYFLLTNDGAMAVHSSFAMPYWPSLAFTSCFFHCHSSRICMSYYAFVQPSMLLSPHCKHADATCCLGSNTLTNNKSLFNLPSWFPQSGDSFHSFLVLPYSQAWPSTMSFNFSNIGNSTPSLNSSTSHSFTPLSNPSSLPSRPTTRTFPPPPVNSHNPNIDPSLDDATVPTHFIDALTNQFNFGDQAQDLRQSLHGFAKVFV